MWFQKCHRRTESLFLFNEVTDRNKDCFSNLIADKLWDVWTLSLYKLWFHPITKNFMMTILGYQLDYNWNYLQPKWLGTLSTRHLLQIKHSTAGLLTASEVWFIIIMVGITATHIILEQYWEQHPHSQINSKNCSLTLLCCFS